MTSIIIYRPDDRNGKVWEQAWYKRLEETWNPPFELPNIAFYYYHDDFFNRHLSIRAARDWQNHPFWFYIAVLFFMGQLAFIGTGVMLRLFALLISHLFLVL